MNDQVDMERRPEMVHGWHMLRIIHFIVCLRCMHPQLKICIAKFDCSDAHCRMLHATNAAIKSTSVMAGVACMALRLAFGGSPNPACVCAFSETLTDVANKLSCTDWDPEPLQSPAVKPEHLLPQECPKEEEPLAKGILPAVEVPVTPNSRKDCFADDTLSVFLDAPANLKKEGHTTPLAVHVMSRPHAGESSEPVFRKPLMAPNKLMTEGRPAEV